MKSQCVLICVLLYRLPTKKKLYKDYIDYKDYSLPTKNKKQKKKLSSIRFRDVEYFAICFFLANSARHKKKYLLKE